MADSTMYIETVIAGFPHQNIPPIIDKPTNTSLWIPLKIIGLNDQSLARPDGGNVYGNLNLVMSDISYNLLPCTAPLPILTMPADSTFGGTQAKILERPYYHGIAKTKYLNQIAYMGALKQQLLGLIQEDFLDDLNHHTTGFNGIYISRSQGQKWKWI